MTRAKNFKPVDRSLNSEQQALVVQYLDLRYWVLNRYFRRYYQVSRLRELMEDAATEALMKAAWYFNPEKKGAAKFNTLAVLMMTQNIGQLITRESKKAREWSGYDIDEAGEHNVNNVGWKDTLTAEIHSGFAEVDDEEEKDHVYNRLLRLCPDQRRTEMVLMRVRGLTTQQIGDHYGITRERARQLVASAVREIRKRMGRVAVA